MPEKPTREDLEDALISIAEILQDLGFLPQADDQIDEDDDEREEVEA